MSSWKRWLPLSGRTVVLPWRKAHTVFIDGNDSRFWERFAVIVSALALLVSSLATYATFRQASLMQAQLTSGERNKVIQNLTEDFVAYCSALNHPPYERKAYVFRDRYGRRYEEWLLTKNTLRSLDHKVESAYFAELDKARSKAMNDSILLVQWTPKSEWYLARGFMIDFLGMNDVLRDLDVDRIKFYKNLHHMANTCLNVYTRVSNTIVQMNTGETTGDFISPSIPFTELDIAQGIDDDVPDSEKPEVNSGHPYTTQP